MKALKDELRELIRTRVDLFDRFVFQPHLGCWLIDIDQPSNSHVEQSFWSSVNCSDDELTRYSTVLPLFRDLSNWFHSQNDLIEGSAVPKKVTMRCFSGLTYELNGEVIPLSTERSKISRLLYVIKSREIDTRDRQRPNSKLALSLTNAKTVGIELHSEVLQLQDLLEKTSDAARIGTWELDLISKTLSWSRVTKVIHEVDQSYVPELCTAIDFYKEGENRIKIENALSNTLSTGEPFDLELILVAATGNEKWVRTMGFVIQEQNTPVKLYGTFQDIDVQKRQQLMLEQSEQRFRGIFNSTYQFIGFLNPKGILLEANETAVRFGGLRREEVINKPFWKARWWQVNDATEKQLQDAIARASKGEFVQYEVLVQGEGTQLLTIDFNLKPLFNEEKEVVSIIAEGRPIQEMIDAKAKLTTSLSILQSVMNASHGVSMISTDLSGIITRFNRGAEKYFGYQANEVIGIKNIIDLHEFDELIARRAERNVSNEWETLIYHSDEDEIELSDWHYIRKNGSTFPAQLAVTSIIEEDKKVGYLFVGVDITRIKTVKEELRNVLNLTKDQNQRLINFAHIVSHNLRSHSGNLLMLLDLLKEGDYPERSQEVLPLLDEAAERLFETVDHLNEVVAINLNSSQSKSEIDLNQVIKAAIGNLHALVLESGMECIIDIETGTVVKGVAAYMDSIILNLLSNAIKYRDSHKKCMIRFSGQDAGRYFELIVSDNGLGIDMAKNRDKIFGLYKTFHGHKDARGLGLFMTKNQVEAMGGRIMVESEVGKGTTFRVLFEK